MDYVATPISDISFEWLPTCGGSSFVVEGGIRHGSAQQQDDRLDAHRDLRAERDRDP